MLLFVPTNVPISFFREYQLVVDVVDINDNVPSFGQPEYSFSVTEVCHVTICWRVCRANGTDMRRNNISVSEVSFILQCKNGLSIVLATRPLREIVLSISPPFAGSSALFDRLFPGIQTSTQCSYTFTDSMLYLSQCMPPPGCSTVDTTG